MTLAQDIIAAVFALLIPVLALIALTSRSMLSIAICVGAAGAMAALVALGLGAGEVALGAAVALGGWAPLVLVALMLLTAGTTKRSRSGPAWLIALPAATLAVAFPLTQPGSSQSVIATPAGVAFWLSLVAMATGAVCIGLLAYGERGSFQRVGAR